MKTFAFAALLTGCGGKDDPAASANTMNAAWVESMAAVNDRLAAEKATITGVVITSAKKTFFAGGNLGDIIATTPDQAQDAAAGFTSRLAAMPDLFRDVRQPGGGMFFRKNGLLFLHPAQVQSITDKMIAAQPMLGTLATLGVDCCSELR